MKNTNQSLEIQEKFLISRAENKSLESISKELNISKTTAFKLDKSFKNEILELRKFNLDTLIERHKLTIENRIETISNIIDKIDDAIDNIDFQEMSPRDLLMFKLKYLELQETEYKKLKSIIDYKPSLLGDL